MVKDINPKNQSVECTKKTLALTRYSQLRDTDDDSIPLSQNMLLLQKNWKKIHAKRLCCIYLDRRS